MGLRERRLCKFNFHGLSASWYDSKLVLHDACCMLQAHLQLAFLSQYFPIQIPPLDGHVPTISPRLHAWRCFVLPNPQTRSRLRKKWFPQLPGNNHQSTCQESPSQFATARCRTEFSRKCPKQDYVLGCALFFGLLTWPPIDRGRNLFSLADRSPCSCHRNFPAIAIMFWRSAPCQV